MTENEFLKPIRKSFKRWYLPVITGVILILIALWTFGNPAKAFTGLAVFFSVSFVISGVIEIVFSITKKRQLDNSLVLGIISVLIGVLLLVDPEISKMTLALYIGFLILIRSLVVIGISFDLKSYGASNWGLILMFGIIGLLFSVVLIWNPTFSGLTIVVWTGMTLLIAGIFNLFLGFNMRKVNKKWTNVSNEAISQYIEAEKRLEDELK